jgi:hypothetical protein
VRVARALAAALALAAVVTPARAQETPAENAVRVDVRALSTALVPGKTQALVIRARAVNTTGEPLRRMRVGLRFGQPIRGRSAIAVGGDPARQGLRIADRVLGDGELPAGATVDADFDVPLAELPFRSNRGPAIYPMRIEMRARFRVVGAVDTYVMWWPGRSPTVRVAWLWPLVEPSHRAVGNEFYDDDLAASVQDGRLATLFNAGTSKRVPMTWAVDPELLDSLHRMTGRYTVRGEPGVSSPVAKAWLDRVRTALHDASVLPLPYADPDLAATLDAPLAPDAARAFQLGREVVRRELGTTGTSLAWPPGPTLDPGVESLLSGPGVGGVVVPYSALPLADLLSYTPSAATPLAANALGSMTAIVAEPQLSAIVASDAAADGPRLVVQRFLADTAMIALERPSQTRDVVVAPPRVWDPVRELATQLVRQTDAAPWLDAVSVDDVVADQQSTAARTRTPPGRPVLARDQLARVLDERRGLQRLRGIFTDPTHAPGELADLDDALLRSVSASWAADAGGGHRLAASVDAEVHRQVDRLRVVRGQPITMTGRSGRIPLTFQNDFGQPVRVRIRLDSRHRLRLDDAAYESPRGAEVVVQPGQVTHLVEGRATTGGLFPLTVDVLAADGTPLTQQVTLRVRSTAYGAVALVVTGVAFGLLLVASATRLVRRRRKPAPPAPTPEPVPAAAP